MITTENLDPIVTELIEGLIDAREAGDEAEYLDRLLTEDREKLFDFLIREILKSMHRLN